MNCIIQKRKTNNGVKTPFLVLFILNIIAICTAQFAGGQGTEESPWQVSSAEQLDSLRDYLGPENSDKHFVQTNNIDLHSFLWDEEEEAYINEGTGWIPIGKPGEEDEAFYGTYNGNGYAVDRLYINRNGRLDHYQALFGAFKEATIKNLGVTNVDIRGRSYGAALASECRNSVVDNCYSTGERIFGLTYVGGLVSTSVENSLITRCYSTAYVTSSSNYCGGLVAVNSESAIIRNCYALGIVEGGQFVGGLIGNNVTDGLIENCYCKGNVPSQMGNAGGFAGRNEAIIKNCFSRGNATGGMGYAGGFVGVNFGGTITNCYSTGTSTGLSTGGLVGFNMNEGVVTNSYWDMETSMKQTSSGGEGRSTEQMVFPYDENTYVDWNFDEIWRHDTDGELNDGYPTIPCQAEEENEEFAGGRGTAESPWQVSTAEQFNCLRNYLGPQHSDKHFVQTHNIDLHPFLWDEEEEGYINEGTGWLPIGRPGDEDDAFYGTYNGNGYAIDRLFISRNGRLDHYQALFGALREATITNLGVTNVEIRGRGYGAALASESYNSFIDNCYSSGELFGLTNVGGLVSINTENSLITRSYSTVEVNSSSNYCGGLVAQNNESAIIRHCYALGLVDGGQFVGGLVGNNLSDGLIEYCYSKGNVPSQMGNAGGFAGRNEATIKNCFCRGNATGGMGYAGGFVGVNFGGTIINCYSTGMSAGLSSGGLVGFNMNEGVVTNSYWDQDTSMQRTSSGGEGRTTAQMTYEYDFEETFIDWDFTETWQADANYSKNNGYPILIFPAVIMLDTPKVTIKIETIENEERVFLTWEPIDDAVSYRIFASTSPVEGHWGNPIAVVEETSYSTSIVGEEKRFFKVIASLLPTE